VKRRYHDGVRIEKLPGWVVDDVTSVREEMAPYVDTSAAERWRITEGCAADAMWAVRASGMPARVLAQVDPLPESSVRALARLRERGP